MVEKHVLTPARVLAVLTETVAARDGRVSDHFKDERRLFARAVLPRKVALREHDRYQGGVALRANEQEIWLHPFLFRLICKNGAIIAHTVATRHLDCLPLRDVEEAEPVLLEAIESCCAPDVFTTSVNRMRSATEREVDQIITHLPMLAKLLGPKASQVLSTVLDRFTRHEDRSMYGVINAVTSVARDTRDPELRWRLEEVGGRLATDALPDRIHTVDGWWSGAKPHGRMERETVSCGGPRAF